MFYYFIIVSCFHLSLASWLLFSNKVQFSSVQMIDMSASKREDKLKQAIHGGIYRGTGTRPGHWISRSHPLELKVACLGRMRSMPLTGVKLR